MQHNLQVPIKNSPLPQCNVGRMVQVVPLYRRKVHVNLRPEVRTPANQTPNRPYVEHIFVKVQITILIYNYYVISQYTVSRCMVQITVMVTSV